MSFTTDKTLLRIAIITAFIQFTNALEYMMFNPIFTFMAQDFGVGVGFAGYVTGAYTAAAVLSGIAAFYWIDRFDKRRVLMLNMALLGLLTLILIAIHQFYLLLLLRFVAGLVGGTTMGVAISLLINASPAPLRGKMLALVISSFSVVSILGMPAMLYLCTHYGWHTAMWGIFALCCVAVVLAAGGIPHHEAAISKIQPPKLSAELLLFAAGNGIAQFSPMLLIPILVPILIHQFGAANADLPWLFFIGGVAGFLSTKLTGNLLARFSAVKIMAVSSLLFVLSLALPLAVNQGAWLFIILFFSSTYARLVACSAITVEYPEDRYRAGFGSLQTALVYLMTTAAFMLSAIIENLPYLLALCAASVLIFQFVSIVLQRRLEEK
jgi:predicted MFS family arabinose efflux permease